MILMGATFENLTKTDPGIQFFLPTGFAFLQKATLGEIRGNPECKSLSLRKHINQKNG